MRVLTSNRVITLFKKDYTHVTVTAGGVAEEVMYPFEVPAGTVITGDLIEFYMGVQKTGSANAHNLRAYINTTPDLTGAPVLIAYLNATGTNTVDELGRLLPVTSTTQLECMAGVSSSRSQFGTTIGTSADIAVNNLTAKFYLILTGQKAVGAETLTGRFAFIKILRP